MSYQQLSLTEPTARKEYQCIWCPEKIVKGEKYTKEASKFNGDFQDHRWHLECWKASQKFFAENPDYDEFEPQGQNRGTSDERCQVIIGGRNQIGLIT